MVDSISQTSVGTSAALVDTLTQRVSTATAAKSSASSGRSIDDMVDLSQAGRAAAEMRDSTLTGKQLTDKLAQSLEQGKALGDSFAARMKAGRQNASTATDNSAQEFGTALRGAVSDILRSGKPGSVLDGVISRLFKR